MALVSVYTRDQWDYRGRWRGVDDHTDHIVLLFREDADEDVEPRVIRRTMKGIVHPADRGPLPDVPYRAYERLEWGWELVEEGDAYPNAHQVIILGWDAYLPLHVRIGALADDYFALRKQRCTWVDAIAAAQALSHDTAQAIAIYDVAREDGDSEGPVLALVLAGQVFHPERD